LIFSFIFGHTWDTWNTWDTWDLYLLPQSTLKNNSRCTIRNYTPLRTRIFADWRTGHERWPASPPPGPSCSQQAT
jgi:hypothetical protein